MVTKKKTFPPARQNADRQWLCNALDNCDGLGVQQAVVACTGCDDAGRELKHNIDIRRQELDEANAREDAIKTTAAAAHDRQAALEILDQVELRAIAERRQVLGAELEALEAAHARVVDDHTHPVFACDKHLAKLPK